MKALCCLALVCVLATLTNAQTQGNCMREGEWTKCGAPPSTETAEPSAMSSSSTARPVSMRVVPSTKTDTFHAQSAAPPRRVADAKFWLAVATPQVLNAAYRAKFGSCYPTTCVEGSGLPPNQHFALFAGLNGLMGIIAYKARKDHSRFWLPAALMLAPFSVYDLQHRPH